MGSIGPPRESEGPSGFEQQTPQKKQKLLAIPPPQREEQKSRKSNSDSESEDDDGMTAEQKERYLKQVRESEVSIYVYTDIRTNIRIESVF